MAVAISRAAPYLVAWSRDPFPQQTETSCPRKRFSRFTGDISINMAELL